MNECPLFSVLIANYNNGRFLMEAVESVRSQTYSNWEIILVDDASTDNSMELYKELEQDNRIHIYYNEQNQGCGYTKRRCAELANGEICGFLDPDDTLSKDALEIMVDYHGTNQDASMIYSRLNCVDVDMHVIRTTSLKTMPVGESLLTFPCWSSFVAFKRGFYLKTEGIDASAQRAVDNDLCYKLEEVGAVLSVDKVLYNYRISTGQNISMGDNAYKAFAWQLRVAVNACKRRGMESKIEDVMAANIYFLIDDVKKTEADKVRKSTSYRIGSFILKPFMAIKKIVGATYLIIRRNRRC